MDLCPHTSAQVSLEPGGPGARSDLQRDSGGRDQGGRGVAGDREGGAEQTGEWS